MGIFRFIYLRGFFFFEFIYPYKYTYRIVWGDLSKTTYDIFIRSTRQRIKKLVAYKKIIWL